jgi:outer membrane protein TolC
MRATLAPLKLLPMAIGRRNAISGSEFRLSMTNLFTGMEKIHRSLLIIIGLVAFNLCGFAQNSAAPDSIPAFTLGQCIDYALQHQPGLNQSMINTSIVKTTNLINLAGWLPQVTVSGTLTHYYQLPTTLSRDSTGALEGTHNGLVNTALPGLTISQVVFEPQLFYALSSAHLYTRQAEQATDSTKIFTVSAVSKSYYNLLLTLEQISVLEEDTARLGRNITDTYNQFVGGIVDKTDYEQAIITFNNSLGQLKQQTENVSPNYAALKQLMGFPPEQQFNVVFDTLQMMQDIYYDTTEALQYDKRIDYQLLQTARDIQHQQTIYDVLSFLPTVSVFYDYVREYQSNATSNLFTTPYPYSYIGLSVNLPIFTGFSRIENFHKSQLQEDVLDWSAIDLKSEIYSEYTTGLANYKSNLYNLRLMSDNKARADTVYRVVSMQYKQGVVAYLNLLVAESNLITSEIGYVDALFQLLSSKIDLEKAMGNIPYKH